MKTTIIGGLLFLIPLAFLAIVLTQAFKLSLMVVAPIDKVIPVHRLAGIAIIDVIAIILILALCYLAGIAARRGWFGSKIEKLDGLLIDMVPGYAVAKGTVSSIGGDNSAANLLQPVLVHFDDYDQIAFQVEASEDRAVVFLPGAPSAWSGSTIVVERRRIQPLDLPVHQAVKLMRILGRGSLEKLKPAVADT